MGRLRTSTSCYINHSTPFSKNKFEPLFTQILQQFSQHSRRILTPAIREYTRVAVFAYINTYFFCNASHQQSDFTQTTHDFHSYSSFPYSA